MNSLYQTSLGWQDSEDIQPTLPVVTGLPL